MDDLARRENADRIQRQLAEPHTRLTDIFETVQRPDRPAVLVLPPAATVVIGDIKSPHGGSPMRRYVIDCPHGNTDMDLMGMDPESDGAVIGNMLRDLWKATGCSCHPQGWGAA